MLKKPAFICALQLALLMSAATAVHAARVVRVGRSSDTGYVTSGFGPRVGFSTGPDQFVVGGQLVIGEVAPDLTFDPSVEIGIGDHETLFGANFDLHYHFHTRSTWRPYVGAGATVNVVNYDQQDFGNRDSQTFGGGSLIVGAGAPTRSGSRFFGELKLGLGDVPNAKFMVGWLFPM